jgi:hypothetical protein
MKDKTAAREGYDRSEVSGGFTAAPEFPGCPHCKAVGLFVCTCGKVGCLAVAHGGGRSADGQTVVCPWCGARGTLGGPVERLNASGDR